MVIEDFAQQIADNGVWAALENGLSVANLDPDEQDNALARSWRRLEREFVRVRDMRDEVLVQVDRVLE